jgi:phage-related protein (TIGR01555 family)
MDDGTQSFRTQDSFFNALTNTGIGAGNLSSGGGYRLNPITRNRMQLEWIYRGNWVARTIVDAPADDMTREGVEIQSEDKPEELEKLNKAAEGLQIWTQLGKALKWGRLYGGSLAYLMIDGQNPATELILDTVKEGQFKGLMPLDRWQVWPDMSDIISEMTPEFGLPRYYNLWASAGTNLPIQKIHHTRLIRFDGQDLPYQQRLYENYWGLSVLEPVWDRIMAFDSTTQGAAQLVYKAHLRTIRIKGLRDILGTNSVAAQGLKQFFDWVRVYQSNEGLTLLDADDEFEVSQYAFGGLADMMLQFAQQLAGAAEIPMVRFFAQSPAGMNATGESDWRNYYDGIKAKQERLLRIGVEKIYALLYRSTLGRVPKKVYTLIFRPLWQMDDEQSAAVTTSVVTAITTLVDKMVYTRSQALKEIRTLASVTNFGSNITDDDIKLAEEDEKEARENPPTPEELGAGTVKIDDPNVRRLAPSVAGAQPSANGAGNAGVRRATA